MDPVSLLIARRANIKIHVIKGDLPENYINIMEMNKKIGTLIS